jgi:hypothetical protein
MPKCGALWEDSRQKWRTCGTLLLLLWRLGRFHIPQAARIGGCVASPLVKSKIHARAAKGCQPGHWEETAKV